MKVLVLAGGIGSRLYPLSTKQKPKQFLKLFDGEPMLITTIKRFLRFLDLSDIIIVTSENYFAQTEEALTAYGMDGAKIVGEPCPKNTLPAILLGVKYALENCGLENEPIIAVPADHIISPAEEFEKTIKLCVKIAKDGKIAVIGIPPTRPETGYGYIKAGVGECVKVQKFTEKPDLKRAAGYLKDGGYFWNSGIYAFTAETLLSQTQIYRKDLYDLFTAGDFTLFRKNFGKLISVSIDVGISEKSDKMYMAHTKIKWSDMGSWLNYYEHCQKDTDGNVIKGNVRAHNCKNCLILAFDGEIITAYQENQIIVLNGDKCVFIPLEKT